ncbi:endonuclease/exonuclease/phosphatase family protein [Tuwongella immobilis]|uniref:Endonuclease/exonuclease/phosphatase domain-containing protein n=1 Tax=Tuwongella immobilis TaxID=692036 RepID=A0A6C2YXV9_9BACT|nr:endonuclease/exonuclease/phosphatase family protein [Tuwongella immobilis]VIP05632.1 Endonuclease/exonuclease/phosphatase family OS=Melioribacter roseus (strain JCM 17771 / P3M-2) GN=MROS_2573 PE=4 SV=1: Exo_endo_phos [Tuwongella immobilis]VTS08620.1 Endonuclease/exonuclease/phosphatase family OS=Melioribacter roseus (strain JCM 17771 / P3M-2) GN=MROS_2573 PE=4 SV=1: Exo_endo_phos [Tuwongella immobilis]
MARWLPVGLMAVLLLGPTPVRAGQLVVACWNVENLFDTVDDPKVELDEEYTPTAEKKWTPERLKRKLKNLAGVIRSMNDGKGPDVLGLGEIENRLVLEMLVTELAPLNRDYRIVHQDSPSDRGIDTAILYDAKVAKLLASTFVFIDADKTRDSTFAELEVAGQKLVVSMNHWPSRGNPEPARITAAQTVRKRIDAMLKDDPNTAIIVMGDLNDEPTNVSIRDHLKAVTDPAARTGDQLLNTAKELPSGIKGTYVYQNKWEFIDHLIVSPGLLRPTGLRWKAGSTVPYVTPEQIFTPNNPNQIPRPNRSYTGNNYHATGISDHLPVIATFEY